MMMTEATWVNGGKKVSGRYHYNWSADTFTIELDQKDRTTGRKKRFVAYGDRPEWGNWRISEKVQSDARLAPAPDADERE